MPFLYAIVADVAGLAIYNGVEVWQSFVPLECALTSNVVWLSAIAGGILTVYNVDLELHWKYFQLCKLEELRCKKQKNVAVDYSFVHLHQIESEVRDFYNLCFNNN